MTSASARHGTPTQRGAVRAVKEWNTAGHCMDEPQNIMLSERSKTRKIMLYDSIYRINPEKANPEKQGSRVVAAWGWW